MIDVYCVDEVFIISKIGGDDFGRNRIEQRTRTKARFDKVTKLVRNLQGQEVISTAVVYLPNMDLSYDSHIEFEGKNYKILTIEPVRTFRKLTHIEVRVA